MSREGAGCRERLREDEGELLTVICGVLAVGRAERSAGGNVARCGSSVCPDSCLCETSAEKAQPHRIEYRL